MIKISVIIPVYNTRQFLKEAVDSIIAQKEFLYEIIIVNDGSTDGSGELLEKLYGREASIKLIDTENKGQGHARNLGTKISSGDFIYYFDSDDISVSGVFKKFHELIEEEPELELFCFSGKSFLDENSSSDKLSSHYLNKNVYKRKINCNCSGEKAFSKLVADRGFYASPPLYIFKESVLQNNDFGFTSYKYEDEAFTHQLFIHSGKTIVINDVYFKRRVRYGSTMQATIDFMNILGYMKTIENLKKLKSLDFLIDDTRIAINARINKFTKEIIILKTNLSKKLNFNQKKKYYKFLVGNIFRNSNLLIFSIKYPIIKRLKNAKKYFKS